MKAIQMNQTGEPTILNYVDIEKPIAAKGQVLIKTSAIGVSYGDIMVQRGVYPIMPTLPATLGFECSGIVESIGEDVSDINTGQSVAVLGTIGCYADYVVADQSMVFVVPDSLDKDSVAAFPITYLTAYHLLHTMGHIKPGQTILLHGAAGGVGTAVIQLAKLIDVTVIGLSSSDDKVTFAKQQGANYVINYNSENVTSKVNEITNNNGVDLILNSIAGKTFEQDFTVLASMGQIIWFGFAAGYPEVNLSNSLGNCFMNSVGIRTFSIYTIFENSELFRHSMKTLVQYLVDGKIKPQIHEKLSLSKANQAHELMESTIVKGRLILEP